MNALLLVLLMSQVDVPPPPVEGVDNFPAPVVGLTQAQDQANSTVCGCGCGRVGCTCQVARTVRATSSVQVYSGWGPWRPWRPWRHRSVAPMTATTETRTKVYRSGRTKTYTKTRPW